MEPPMTNSSFSPIHIIGGGLAGSEAAWQIANAGVPVILHEMRGVPGVKTDAHHTDGLAELVCSNSFRSDDWEHNAVGLLHAEMRALDPAVTLEPVDFRAPFADCCGLHFTGIVVGPYARIDE